MKLANASDVLAPKVRSAISETLTSNGQVVVPPPTDADMAKFRAFLASPQGSGLLATLRSPELAQKPLFYLDPTWHGLLGSELLRTQTTDGAALAQLLGMGPSAPTPLVAPLMRPALSPGSGVGQSGVSEGTGAMVGGAVAAIAELTVGVDQTGVSKVLVTLLGAVLGAVTLPLVTNAVMSGKLVVKLSLEGAVLGAPGTL